MDGQQQCCNDGLINAPSRTWFSNQGSGRWEGTGRWEGAREQGRQRLGQAGAGGGEERIEKKTKRERGRKGKDWTGGIGGMGKGEEGKGEEEKGGQGAGLGINTREGRREVAAGRKGRGCC